MRGAIIGSIAAERCIWHLWTLEEPKNKTGDTNSQDADTRFDVWVGNAMTHPLAPDSDSPLILASDANQMDARLQAIP